MYIHANNVIVANVVSHSLYFSRSRYTIAAPDKANEMRRIAMMNPSTPPIVSVERPEFKALRLGLFPWVSHLQVLSWIVGLSLLGLIVETPSSLTVLPLNGNIGVSLVGGWIVTILVQTALAVYDP